MWTWGPSTTPQSNVLAQSCGSLLCLIFVKPTVIIYPLDYLPLANQKQQEILETIIQDVAKHCEIPIRAISFKNLWLKSPPKAAAGKALDDFLQDVSSPPNQTSIPKDLNRQVKTRLFTTFFTTTMNFALFTSKNITERLLQTRSLVGDGSTPARNVSHFFNSRSHNREIGSGIARAQRNDAMQRMEIYKDWVLQNVLHVDDETALVVLPIKDAEPNYRDTDPGYVPYLLDYSSSLIPRQTCFCTRCMGSLMAFSCA